MQINEARDILNQQQPALERIMNAALASQLNACTMPGLETYELTLALRLHKRIVEQILATLPDVTKPTTTEPTKHKMKRSHIPTIAIGLALVAATWTGATEIPVKFINLSDQVFEATADVPGYYTNIPPHTVMTVPAPTFGGDRYFLYGSVLEGGFTWQLSWTTDPAWRNVVTIIQDECGQLQVMDSRYLFNCPVADPENP